MIVFDLKCGNGHIFEAWFRGSDAYDEQQAAGAIACPICADAQVTKAPMAPNIASRKGDRSPEREGLEQERAMDIEEPVAPPVHRGGTTHMLGDFAQELKQALEKVRVHVEENFDYVGRKFPEEARKIHYGEVKPRPIYGVASPEESEELKDEGVEVVALPFPPKHDS